MKVFSLIRKQAFPISISEAWDFFTSAENLKKITPSYLDFNILSELPTSMYPGMIIKYTVCPIGNLPITWITEITQMQALRYFVDEQRFGPYRFWHHQHHFNEHPLGTEVIDIVNYGLPLGILGRLGHWLYVEQRLIAIFKYRAEVLKTFLGDGNKIQTA